MHQFSTLLMYLALLSVTYFRWASCVPFPKGEDTRLSTPLNSVGSELFEKKDGSRQYFGNGNGNGNFNQNGNGNGNFNQNGGNNNNNNNGGGGGNNQQQEEEDDGDETTRIPGPGAISVLTGLFGIGNAILKGNGQKVIESTLNFYPPSLREKAKEELNVFLGKTTTTKKPVVAKASNSNSTTVATAITPAATATTIKPKTKATTTTVKTTTEEDEYDYAVVAAAA